MRDEALTVGHPRGAGDDLDINQRLLKVPVILCVGPVFQQLRKFVPAPLHVWRLVSIEPASLTVEVAENQICALRNPPLFTVALVASNSEAVTLAVDGAAWLRANGARATPDPIVVMSKGMAAFAAELIGQLATLLEPQAELITTLSRELASFRIRNENLQNHFNAVEAILARKGLQAYDLDFVNEPGDSRANVLKEAAKNRVAQVLPVGSNGLSAVGIHLADARAGSNGFLQAQIASLEDGAVIDTWCIPISALRDGWNVFGFERTLAGVRRTLELTVAAVGGGADVPCLSLGAPQPIERFRVHDADSRQSLADASLAVQVWTGLAAVALPSWATYWPSRPRAGNTAGISLHQEVIAPDKLARAALENADEVKFAFEAVQALIPERAVSCHPPAFGMTVARLPDACPARALRVSAHASVDNAKSREVEFALVTAADGTRARALLSGDMQPAAGESFSGWVKVSPLAKKAVNAFISTSVAQPQDIFVATRMFEAGNHDFAWAKFKDLTAVLQEPA